MIGRKPAQPPAPQPAAAPTPPDSASTPHGESTATPAGAEPGRRRAREHYLRGNRFFAAQAWRQALAEWRQATRLWRPPSADTRQRRRPWAQLRAVLLLLLTVLLVYNAIYMLFPRASMDMLALNAGQQDQRSWWERWLDTGRPAPLMPGQLGLRDWWVQLRERWLDGNRREGHRREEGVASGIPKRWAELMRRYGRLGAIENWDLDLPLISGNGLSRMGDYGRAVQVLQDSISGTWDPARLGNLYQALANVHYYQGYALQQDGLARYDLRLVAKAAEAYEQSVRYAPRALSYGNLGWMFYLLEDYERAEDYSRTALRMNRNLEYVQLNLGLINLAQDRVFDAFANYRDVIGRQPEDEVYLGGINDLRELVRDKPGRFPHAYLMIGLLAASQGDFTQARAALERFLASPFTGSNWRHLAERVLTDMNTAELER
ncbi:MAG: tetratricopeptide repeat protein [Candidatus Lambdaproteobacteria bacterium]|nr:tetratricopeptide repeat protein [Candidatus Lambdaproteobacteria bacterium]